MIVLLVCEYLKNSFFVILAMALNVAFLTFSTAARKRVVWWNFSSVVCRR